MVKANLKYYVGITAIVLIGSLHNIFFENNDKYDIYLFYNHKRYLTNILFDISNLFNFSLLTYWLIGINKRIFKPLFYMSLIIWVSYFTTYNQITSLFTIPLYGLIILYRNIKQKKNAKRWER